MRRGVTAIEMTVVVSIIGTDNFREGYNAAKLAQEEATLAGTIPARVLRAAQFHEFVEVLVDWGTQGEVSYVPKMRTQLGPVRGGSAGGSVVVDVMAPLLVLWPGSRPERPASPWPASIPPGGWLQSWPAG